MSPVEAHRKLKKRPHLLPHYLVATALLWAFAFLANGGHV